MTKVDFTNWLHSELDAVFNREQTPEQMMLKAIPMIHELSSQNNGKPLVSGSLPLIQIIMEAQDEIERLWHGYHPDGRAGKGNEHIGKLNKVIISLRQ